MATLVLDFDSCLVPVESLDLHAKRKLASRPEVYEGLERLTADGMEGRVSFEDSLRGRLEVLGIDRREMQDLGQELAGNTSLGAGEMVARLQDAGHEVWIVSGGFQEVLLPVARGLGIPDAHVQGVRALFDEAGRLTDLDPDLPFHISKVLGMQSLGVDWPRPAVGVGDGMTDLALLEAGFVDAFIAYIEHAKRQSVLDRSKYRAENMAEVERLTEKLWLQAMA